MDFKLQRLFILGLSIIVLVLAGCDAHPRPPQVTDYFNPELIGHWTNENGCDVDFVKNGNHYLVTSFTDVHGHQLNNFGLNSNKTSIMTQFSAEDKSIKFSGNFAEGMLVINGYCSEALHKISY